MKLLSGGAPSIHTSLKLNIADKKQRLFDFNRKPPLTYNGENGVSTFSRLQVTRTCIKSQMSSNFGQIGSLTMELAALEHLKNFL